MAVMETKTWTVALVTHGWLPWKHRDGYHGDRQGMVAMETNTVMAAIVKHKGMAALVTNTVMATMVTDTGMAVMVTQ